MVLFDQFNVLNWKCFFPQESGGGKVKSKKKPAKKTQSYIAETAEGIVDLLDPSAAQLVTTSKPNSGDQGAKQKPKSMGDFQIAPDGRIIIKVSQAFHFFRFKFKNLSGRWLKGTFGCGNLP